MAVELVAVPAQRRLFLGHAMGMDSVKVREDQRCLRCYPPRVASVPARYLCNPAPWQALDVTPRLSRQYFNALDQLVEGRCIYGWRLDLNPTTEFAKHFSICHLRVRTGATVACIDVTMRTDEPEMVRNSRVGAADADR
ncbi:hypothetical protein [Mesorhizobium amorphae]|uniref:hypothetical protein n=1 Tax=Mesorhizobium amorphae TaxID=71433 RepID=UPI00177CA290|nr:hypothetical protein [Mesorhizobium amorphae]